MSKRKIEEFEEEFSESDEEIKEEDNDNEIKKEENEMEEEDVYLSDDFENDEGEIESDFEFKSDEEDTSEEVKIKGIYQEKTGLFKDVNDSDDSSEDENEINTIGNVPLNWYEEYDHIGYTKDGKKIMRKKQKDSLENLIDKHDDPEYL
jgi:ribosome biogenesis protein ERB1